MAEGTSDFRLISKRVLLALREVSEYHRFYRGIIPWLGFRTALLPYEPGERLAGAAAEVVYVGSLWFSGKRTLLVPGWSSLVVITTAGLGAIIGPARFHRCLRRHDFSGGQAEAGVRGAFRDGGWH